MHKDVCLFSFETGNIHYYTNHMFHSRSLDNALDSDLVARNVHLLDSDLDIGFGRDLYLGLDLDPDRL